MRRVMYVVVTIVALALFVQTPLGLSLVGKVLVPEASQSTPEITVVTYPNVPNSASAQSDSHPSSGWVAIPVQPAPQQPASQPPASQPPVIQSTVAPSVPAAQVQPLLPGMFPPRTPLDDLKDVLNHHGAPTALADKINELCGGDPNANKMNTVKVTDGTGVMVLYTLHCIDLADAHNVDRALTPAGGVAFYK